MQVQLNRPATIAGVTYGKGSHAMPENVKDDWFFEALINDGAAIILREEVDIKAEADLNAEAAKAQAEAKADAEAKAQADTIEAEAKAALDLLEGNVKEVADAIEGLSVETLTALQAHEIANKNRVGVLTAIQAKLHEGEA